MKAHKGLSHSAIRIWMQNKKSLILEHRGTLPDIGMSAVIDIAIPLGFTSIS